MIFSYFEVRVGKAWEGGGRKTLNQGIERKGKEKEQKKGREINSDEGGGGGKDG